MGKTGAREELYFHLHPQITPDEKKAGWGPGPSVLRIQFGRREGAWETGDGLPGGRAGGLHTYIHYTVSLVCTDVRCGRPLCRSWWGSRRDTPVSSEKRAAEHDCCTYSTVPGSADVSMYMSHPTQLSLVLKDREAREVDGARERSDPTTPLAQAECLLHATR